MRARPGHRRSRGPLGEWLRQEQARRAGCVELKRRRATGRVVGVYNSEAAGLDDGDGTMPWSTVCEDHGWIIGHETLALARAHAAHPDEWCEVCMYGAEAVYGPEGDPGAPRQP